MCLNTQNKRRAIEVKKTYVNCKSRKFRYNFYANEGTGLCAMGEVYLPCDNVGQMPLTAARLTTTGPAEKLHAG